MAQSDGSKHERNSKTGYTGKLRLQLLANVINVSYESSQKYCPEHCVPETETNILVPFHSITVY